ncbi:MAG: hypothetical protein EHM70_17120 [Chloroflexota bacterium]|nr:MAG: hypothetical protein EHM70_17120 [Chloroflexota bacterium]
MKSKLLAISWVLIAPTISVIVLLFFLKSTGQSLVGSALAANNQESAPPLVTGIHPGSAPNDLDTTIVITGSGFTAVLSGAQVITTPVVAIGNNALLDVSWVSSATITATVPWGLDTGVYSVTVTNPDGLSSTLSGAFTVTQGIGVWTSDGPYGGAVTTILVDPLTPTTVYATVQAPYSASGIGLFRSLDGGEHWAMIFAEIGNQFHSADLSIPAPSVIYVDKWGEGLYRSENGGDTWVALPAPAGIGENLTPYAHPTDPQVVYAASDCTPGCGGVFRSDDRGAHWSDRSSGITDTQVTALAFDPANPLIMYAGTSNGNIFRSINGGSSWIFNGQPDQFISNLAVNPFGSHEVWAAGADSSGHWGYLWKSSTITWTQVLTATGLENRATSIVFSQAVSGTMWIGTLQGSLKSIDGGNTWEPIGAPAYSINALAVVQSNTQVLYLGSNGQGVYMTTDGGISWVEANQGLAGIYPTGLAIHPENPAVVYATAHGPGTFMTRDGGGSWLRLPSNNAWPRSPVVDPFNPRQVYIGTTNGVNITENDGQTWNWVVLDSPPPYSSCRVELLSILPAGQPGHLVAGVGFIDNSSNSYSFVGGGIYTSTDYGQSWGYVDVGQVISPAAVLASDPNHPGTLFAGTGSCCGNSGTGVWKSVDGGASWSPSGLPVQQITGLAVDPYNSQVIYAASLEKFYISYDGGAVWALKATQDFGMDKLLVVPTIPPTIYQYGWRGMIRSTNGGQQWDRADGSLGYAKIGVMAAHTEEGRVVLYAGTGGGLSSGTVQSEYRDMFSAEDLIGGGVYRNTIRLPSHFIYLPVLQR